MSFWDLFSNKNESENQNRSTLYYEVKENFSSLDESELIKVTGIAALLARVAYVDFNLDPSERKNMNEALQEFTRSTDSTWTEEDISKIVDLSIKHVKELAGLENHKIVHSLKEVLDQSTRYEVIVALFYLAASDGVVENIESEEIRIIVKGFDLSDKHFTAARAKVSNKLGALKS